MSILPQKGLLKGFSESVSNFIINKEFDFDFFKKQGFYQILDHQRMYNFVHIIYVFNIIGLQNNFISLPNPHS